MPRRPAEPPLGVELAQLEQTDPAVRAAATSFEETKRRIIEGRSHPVPCTLPDCEWHASVDIGASDITIVMVCKACGRQAGAGHEQTCWQFPPKETDADRDS